jgi:hypothetical protein
MFLALLPWLVFTVGVMALLSTPALNRKRRTRVRRGIGPRDDRR